MPTINSVNKLDEICDVLRKYFEYDDNGNPNEDYDPGYSASNAIDDIHDIVGKI